MKAYVLFGALLLAACVESSGRKYEGRDAAGDASACQDSDGDEYGEGCARGGDCDDSDPDIHTGCTRCEFPQQGCDCSEGSKPVSCYLSPSETPEGVMCHEGTRYCRAGQWSACESVVSYPRPEPVSDPQAIINPSTTPVRCNDCNVNCYAIRDNLDPSDAGVLDASSMNAQFADGGGLTIKYTIPDSGLPELNDAGTFDPTKCVLGTAPDIDCDGIPDKYDPYPSDKSLASAHGSVYLNLRPGQTGSSTVKLDFKLNTADVYLWIDQTGSMDEERAKLKSSLISGDFIDDPSYECADYDFDGVPNNELKAQGVVGAIRCIIRDVNIGVGWHREIPFYPYGLADNIAFRNLLDMSSNVSSINTAVGLLATVGNIDWPENGLITLNSLIVNQGMYFGLSRPGVPPKTSCPPNTWGYPCFRNGSIPIVILFTDAPLHNGPPNNADPYDSANLTYFTGDSTQLQPIANTNETYANAADLGDLTDKVFSYSGRTTGMASDFPYNATSNSCVSSSAGASPDALFKFTLSQEKTFRASTAGSDFDTVLSIYRGSPTPVVTLPGYPNTNDTASNAYSFGNAANRSVLASGNSSSLVSDYSANDFGGCTTAAGAKDAAFTFNLTTPTRIALDTMGSSYNTVLGLFSGTPSTTTVAAVDNTNDTFASAYAVGNLIGKNLTFTGSSSAATILATYKAAQLACPAASAPVDAATDAVYSFSLSQAATVRLSAEESTAKVVLALTDTGNDYLSTAAVTANEAEATAYNIGALENISRQYTGNTSSMAANYSQQIVGCNAQDASKDAVYKFTLSSPKSVYMDTNGSTMDTVLGLFRGAVTGGETYVTLPNQTHDTGLTAYNLGTVNGTRLITTNASTNTGVVADYSATQIGCNAVATSPDHVYKFSLSSPTKVRVDTLSTTWDTVVSIHNGPLPDLITTAVVNSNESQATALATTPTTSNPNLRFTGSTTGMAADVVINDNASCFAANSSPDAVYRLNVPVAGNYEVNTTSSSFDTVIGVFPTTISNTPVPTPTAIAGNTGDKLTGGTALTVPSSMGAMDGQYLSYTGSTSTAVSDMSFSSCSATSTTKDVFYQFKLNSTRTITIDTIGSTMDTVVGVYNAINLQQGCDDNSGGGTASKLTLTLLPGTYYAIIKGKGSGTTKEGAYQITFRDNTVATSNMVACDDNSGGGTTSKLTGFLNAGTYYVVVKGKLAANSGSYILNVKQTDYISSANQIDCDDDYGALTTSYLEDDLPAGDYYIVVKGKSSSGKGAYRLTVQDVNTPPASAEISCNDDVDWLNSYSKLEASLGIGTYYVVVKGSATSSGAYTLNIKDNAYAATQTLQCDYNSGPSAQAVIERALPAGNYRVVVKGKASADKGLYRLNLRDLTNVPTGRVGACDYNSGTAGKSHLEADLTAGTYTVVMKSTSSSAGGAYNLYLRDATNTTIGDNPAAACNNNAATDPFWDIQLGEKNYPVAPAVKWSAMQATLTPGTYYAMVKGYSTANNGYFQLNLGAGAVKSATFTPPVWSDILGNLQAKNVRVMSVLSCNDDAAHGNLINGDCNRLRAQGVSMANATNALGKNLSPLVFDIDKDGSGLDKTVVNGVAALANYLEMNVQAQVVFEPDANPGFIVTVKAIDAAGDGCNGIVGNEHQKCLPGASPKFEISFTNPSNNPVVPNSKDPNGGYTFRGDLIGDGKFVVDSVPIYIVPEPVNSPKVVGFVAANGSYWQNISAPGCMGNQRPDWHDLSWNAAVPRGTSVTYAACASNNTADLATCTPTQIATVTGGGSCSADSDCTNGYCSVEKNCQTITGANCSADAECSLGATCKSGKCTYSGQPVYAGTALGATNFQSNLRMLISMTANVADNTAPVVHDWGVSYVCNNIL